MIYDVSIVIHSHMNRLTSVPGYVLTKHVDRASRAGAFARSISGLKGLERKHVSYMQIQECPGGERCWYAQAVKS